MVHGLVIEFMIDIELIVINIIKDIYIFYKDAS